MVKKAHFVTGKGGVGKSLVAALLARFYSLKSQHVLLAELSEISFYKDYLDLTEIQYKPSAWLPNVDISQWSGPECLKEYALHLLKIKKLYELFFENPVTRSLVQVAPGLQELAILGKVTSSPRRHGPPPPPRAAVPREDRGAARLKELYRKVVRQLHPDANGDFAPRRESSSSATALSCAVVTPGFTIPLKISRISRTIRLTRSMTAISSRFLSTGPFIYDRDFSIRSKT